MRTLYESILDIDLDKKDEEGAQALKRYRNATKKRYESAFFTGTAKYNFAQNTLKSDKYLVITTRNDMVNVMLVPPHNQGRFLTFEDWDKEHATLDCPLKINSEALNKGLLYKNMHHVHHYIHFYSDFMGSMSLSAIKKFFGGNIPKDKIIDLDQYYNKDMVSDSCFSGLKGLVLGCPFAMKNKTFREKFLCSIKDVKAKKILFHNFTTESDTNLSSIPKKVLLQVLQNNPGVEIYFRLHTAFDKMFPPIYQVSEYNGQLKIDQIFDSDWNY